MCPHSPQEHHSSKNSTPMTALDECNKKYFNFIHSHGVQCENINLNICTITVSTALATGSEFKPHAPELYFIGKGHTSSTHFLQ